MNVVDKDLARKLIGAGVHFGHGVSRWNPKMEPYIFGKRGMIHIINVKETLKGLLIGQKLLADVVSSGKDVVFVGTKRQAQKAVVKAADACSMHHVSERWLGGMLTNFRTIRSRLQRLEELEAMEAGGKLAAESKKQATRLKREMKKIKTNLGGVRKMSKLPGVMVVVDCKKEHIALREARKIGIPAIGIIDTDSDPDEVDVAIPANDDSIKAIELILLGLADGVKVGKTMVKPMDTSGAPAGVRKRSRRRVLASASGEEEAESEEAAEKPQPDEQPDPEPRQTAAVEAAGQGQDEKASE